jgi:bifunctional non-homologous end joining protein LigD
MAKEHRADSEGEGHDGEPMPVTVAPMLATLGPLPPPRDDDRYGYEIKWDGVRAITSVDGDRLHIETRTGKDATKRYPELREIGRPLGATAFILDGEVVAFDERGRPSFETLQRRMHVESETVLRGLTREIPITYMIFDVLWLDGYSTLTLPYARRRELLEGLQLSGPSWQTPAYHAGDGAALLEASRGQGLEGVVAKRLDSLYEPGRRSRSWIKVKNHLGQELVIGGWLPGEGNRAGRLGALLVGYYEPDGRLHYAGRVGTGFNDKELDRLAALLELRTRATCPFDPPPKLKNAHYVEPVLVAQVEFTEWTNAGIVRHPSYKGLRDDKDARAVVREGFN